MAELHFLWLDLVPAFLDFGSSKNGMWDVDCLDLLLFFVFLLELQGLSDFGKWNSGTTGSAFMCATGIEVIGAVKMENIIMLMQQMDWGLFVNEWDWLKRGVWSPSTSPAGLKYESAPGGVKQIITDVSRWCSITPIGRHRSVSASRSRWMHRCMGVNIWRRNLLVLFQPTRRARHVTKAAYSLLTWRRLYVV